MVKYEVRGNVAVVTFNYDPDYVARIKQVPGARWNPEEKVWQIPAQHIETFRQLFDGEIIDDKLPDFHADIVKCEVGTAIPLYEFQKFGASFLAQRAIRDGFAFLCDATGIGKSPQSLGAWLLLKDMLGTDFLPTLVVTPAAVRHQWVVDAIPKFLGSDTDVVEVVGTQQQRLALYGTAEITVVNYEALMRDAELIPKDTKFALFIFDECQRLKNKSGVTYRAVKKLLKRMPGAFKFFLTATPLMNNLDELYALFELAQPGFFGKYSQFKQEHMKFVWTGKYPKLVGYKKLGVIAEKIAPHILRRTAEHPEVAAALPEFVEQVLYVEPSSLQRQLHDLIHDDWLKTQQELATLEGPAREQVEARCRGQIVLMQGAADDPRLFTMSSSRQTEYYLEHVGNIPDSPSPKLQALCELVNDLVPDGKVVIFTCFERMARLIHGALQQYNPALFTGKNKAEREVELKRFWQDPSCKVIVMTDAGGVGLNIQIARFLINFDLPWSPGQLEQRYGRIKRFGSQYRSVVVFNMLTLGTIDERIMQALQRKQEVFAALVHAYNHEPLV
jgi:SNF2 family DNA or RNA helicase